MSDLKQPTAKPWLNEEAFMMTYLLTAIGGMAVIATSWRAWPILIFLGIWFGVIFFRPQEDVRMTFIQWLLYMATILGIVGVLLMAIPG